MSEFLEHQPAIFFGHGSPMNALGGPYAEIWSAIGRARAKPKAVLMVSAHWYVDGLAVTAMRQPKTIHDFYGFPKPLYDVRYPAPGNPWLVDRVSDLLKPYVVARDEDWGLDHGTWSVLTHVFPNADVPVVQLSIDRTKPAAYHYDMGKRLAPLREEGVLIAGSGDVVHNLRAMKRMEGAPAYDWAQSFHDRVKSAITAHDYEALVNYGALGEAAALSIPTPEHYLPLLYVLGAAAAHENAQFFTDSIDLGSISMLGVQFGARPASV